MNHYFYQPSGKFSLLSIILFMVLLVVIIPLLSAIYSLILWYTPFYLKLLITVSFGAILSWIFNELLKIGKVRNIKFAVNVAVVSGIATIYFVWTSYISLFFNAGDTMTAKSGKFKGISVTKTFFDLWDFFDISLTPSTIPNMIIQLYSTGAWKIFSHTVNGPLLAFFWFSECLIIILMICITGTEQASEPFSEYNNSWYKKKILPYYLEMPNDIMKFKEDIGNGKNTLILSLNYASKHSLDYGEITVFSHENEFEAFIDFTNIKVSFDKKGNEVYDKTQILKNVRVSLSDLNKIEARFGLF